MSRTRSKQYKSIILERSFLCIDPSSGATGDAGWAIFDKGRVIDQGVISVSNMNSAKHKRLRELMKCLFDDFERTELMIMEEIRGKHTKETLVQACGVFIAGIDCEYQFDMNVATWQAIAKKLGGWKKHTGAGLVGDKGGREGDEVDAEFVGWAAIAFALGYNQKGASKAANAEREAVLVKVRELM